MNRTLRAMRLLKKPSGSLGMAEVREATTGRLVVLPRVWAVGAGVGLSALPVREAGISPLRVAGLGRENGRQPAGAAGASEEGEVAFYRKYTEALLRRYQRMRMGAGRVSSPMDREMFRGRMSHYRVQGFDDAVIFCVDVERCLARLNGEDQRLVRRIAVQQYTLPEAAGLLGLSLRSCSVLYGRAVDRVTRLFLEAGLLEPGKELSRG